MKKVFITIISMLLPMMATGQVQSGTVIAQVDFTTATEFTGWTQFDDSQIDGKVELTSDGLSITVDIQTGQLWQPMVMVIPDGTFNLVEDGDYKVIVTAKFPTDGLLQINMGSWSANDQAQFPVTATGDFQVVECEFPGWSVNATGAHLLFCCGDFKGTTIVKSIEVYDMAAGEAQKKLYVNDFTGITEFTGWSQFDDSQTDGKVEVDPDGVAITVGIQTGQLWQPQVMVVPDGSFDLKEDGNYKVIVTAKFPKDGTLQINMGTWSANDEAQFPVIANGDFQVVECDFEGWSVDAEGAHLLFQCGDFKGTTILKKIEIKEGSPNYDKWTVAGDEKLFGANWDFSINKLETYDGENFILTKKNIFLPKGIYEFKVFNSISPKESYPSSNASLVIDENAIYTVKFNFNANTKELSSTATNVGELFFNYIAKGKIAEVKQIPNNLKGDIVIPPTVTHEGEEYTVTKIGDNAFQNCSRLSSVTIPNSVISIGSYAFDGCSNLTSITIPNSVTSIGGSAFYGCSSLTSITIPNSVTSIANEVFHGCRALTSVTIPNRVTSIGSSAFDGCSGLTSITIPNSVTSIGGNAFHNCRSLTSVTIPNSVTTIGSYAFQNCSRLSSITIPSSVTSISYGTFDGCSNLTSINIPNSVSSIGNSAFSSCSTLTSITIPNSVINLGGSAFRECSSLTSINLGNSVISIGDYAFYGCTVLSSVNIPNSVSYIYSNAFYGCTGLTTLTIGSGVNSIGSQAFANCEKLTDVYCLAENVPSTSSDAFENSYIEYATLHVPAASFSAYQNIEPWKNFQKIVAIGDGEIPETQKCATPTIKYENGIIKFSCETEGVEFISDITPAEINRKYDSEIVISNTYKVTVYATKAGYNNSDKASIEIQASSGILGDIDGDGKVNVADHVKLSDIIMKQK